VNPPQFTDGPQVPLMTKGLINAETLHQLAEDLEVAAEVLSIREKASAATHSAPDEASLAACIDHLLNGVIRAAQIRYRYAGNEWTDTITATNDGFQVVRCARLDDRIRQSSPF
jgi:hypothetical protein